MGLIFVICSYIFSEHLQNKKSAAFLGTDASKEVTTLTEEMIKEKIDFTLNQMIDDTIDNTESKLDKVSIKKISEISEYSDKVIDEINKTHSEIMFLYNMLNDKELDIKNTIKEIDILKKNVNSRIEEKPNTDYHMNELVKEDYLKMLENEAVAAVNEESGQQFNNNNIILELYKQGKSIMEIAKELGLGIGEVRLVIDLFNKEGKGNSSKEEA